MNNRSRVILAAIFIGLGVLFLLEQLFNFSIWAVLWPLIIILLGVILITSSGTNSKIKFSFVLENDFGECDFSNENIYTFVNETSMDFTDCQLPEGETRLQYFSFVTEMDITLPKDAAFSISMSGFVNETQINGSKKDLIFSPAQYTSPNYSIANKRLRIEVLSFVNDLTIRTL